MQDKSETLKRVVDKQMDETDQLKQEYARL